MKNPRRLRQIASLTLLLLTAAAFIWYLRAHPDYITELLETDPRAIAAVIGVNVVLIGVMTGVYYYTVRLAGGTIPGRENFLLTIYSSIANFFGPLQSGPGVRAVYLKQKRGVRLRDYTFATLVYYAMFAVINAVFLAIGTRPWWQTVLAAAAAGGFSYVVLAWVKQQRLTTSSGGASRFSFAPRLLAILFCLTLLQTTLVTVRYYIELSATGASVSVGQAVSYTGAANFAVFASITPDGVGIREAFLLFSQSIHGVNTQEIVGANLLDRASYILFLALLFIVAVSMHAKDKITRARPEPVKPTRSR